MSYIYNLECLSYNIHNPCHVVVVAICRNGIDLILNTKVKAVERHSVTVSDASGAERDIPFGACVWATGVAMHPVIKQASRLHQPHSQLCVTYLWLYNTGTWSCSAIGMM